MVANQENLLDHDSVDLHCLADHEVCQLGLIGKKCPSPGVIVLWVVSKQRIWTLRERKYNRNFKNTALQSQIGQTGLFCAVDGAQHKFITCTGTNGPSIKDLCNGSRHLREARSDSMARWSRHQVENVVDNFSPSLTKFTAFLTLSPYATIVKRSSAMSKKRLSPGSWSLRDGFAWRLKSSNIPFTCAVAQIAAAWKA